MKLGRIYIYDLKRVFRMKPSELEISLSVESYDEKKVLKTTEIATLPSFQTFRDIIAFDNTD